MKDGPMRDAFSIRFRVPQPALAPHVTSFYLLDCAADGVDDWLHPEWANIRFAIEGNWAWAAAGERGPPQWLADATLFGPMAKAARIIGTPGARVIGVGLTPRGWAQLVGEPAIRFANRAVPLAGLFPETAELLLRLRAAADDDTRVDRLGDWLTARLSDPKPCDPHVDRLHRALVSGNVSTVPAFADEVCVSERTLERLCPKLFGFAPKKLLRRQRFLRTLDKMQRNPGRTFTDSLDGHYTDQSHFVREFKAHMGMSPSAYFGLARPLMQAAGRARAEMLGETMQGLHAPQHG